MLPKNILCKRNFKKEKVERKKRKMKLILSSNDFGHPESAKFIYDHLCKPIDEYRVLYFPNEKATNEKIKSGKYESRLASFGFQKKNIYVFDYYDPARFFAIDIDMIYISGGNTFGTLKRIRESGADRLIVEHVHNGAVYIGGSAGAHIASANIAHVAKYDNDIFGLTDFAGLGLYKGIFVCHYIEDSERKSDLKELRSLSKYPVIALCDGESVIIKEE